MQCLVVDDQRIFLDLLASLVESFPEVIAVAKADSVKSARAISTQQELDIAIIDLKLPDGNGAELATFLVEQHPDIKLIILSGAAQEYIYSAELENSLYGIVDKADAFDSLRLCLNKIISPAHRTLTERQQEIFYLIGEGKSNKQISKCLGCAPSTVETHRKAIAQRLNMSGAELIRAAALSQARQSIN